jgi:hypothetical protein
MSLLNVSVPRGRPALEEGDCLHAVSATRERRTPQARRFRSADLSQNWNWTLNLKNRAWRIDAGFCQSSPNVLFCASTVSTFGAL